MSFENLDRSNHLPLTSPVPESSLDPRPHSDWASSPSVSSGEDSHLSLPIELLESAFPPLERIRPAPLVVFSRSAEAQLEGFESLLNELPGVLLSLSVPVSDAAARISRALNRLQGLSPERSARWAGELAAQCRLMGAVEGVSHVVLSVELIAPAVSRHTGRCEGFHVDSPPRRILTTWSGPATEWVQRADVDAERFGQFMRNQKAVSAGSFDFLMPNAPVHQLSTGDVAIVRANEWIHRRPWSSVPRLFSVIDPA